MVVRVGGCRLTMPIEVYIDNLTINGATFNNSGFEDGTLDGWNTYVQGGDDVIEISSNAYEGQYSCRIYDNYNICGIAYPLPSSCSTSDIINVHYNITSADYSGGDCLFINLYLSDEDSNYKDIVYDTEPTANGWISASCDLSGLNTNTIIYFGVTIGSFPPPGHANATVYLDDFELVRSEWTGFTNGDFESGDLDGWNVSGPASIVTSPVQGGTYACQLNDAASIYQQIDLTDVQHLKVYCNIPNAGTTLTASIILNNYPVKEITVSYQTNGWHQINFDTTNLTGSYILKLSSSGGSSYVDTITQYNDITSSAPAPEQFDYNRPFTYTTGSGYAYATINPTGGIDNTPCIELNPHYIYWGGDSYAMAYTYVDTTNRTVISFKYKIPVFDNSYVNYYCAWFKVKLEQTGSPTIDITIADKTQGVTTDWADYTIDISSLTGIYKLTFYAQTHDQGWELHPSILVNIDNVLILTTIPLEYDVIAGTGLTTPCGYKVSTYGTCSANINYCVKCFHYVNTYIHFTESELEYIDDTGKSPDNALTHCLIDVGKYLLKLTPESISSSRIARKIYIYTTMALRMRQDV